MVVAGELGWPALRARAAAVFDVHLTPYEMEQELRRHSKEKQVSTTYTHTTTTTTTYIVTTRHDYLVTTAVVHNSSHPQP